MNYQMTTGIWIQIGIASFRSGPFSVPNITCQSTTPTGFTRIRPFLSWIYFITKLPDPDNPTTATSTSNPGSSTTNGNTPSSSSVSTRSSSSFVTTSTEKYTTVDYSTSTEYPPDNQATSLKIMFLPTGDKTVSFALLAGSFLVLFISTQILAVPKSVL